MPNDREARLANRIGRILARDHIVPEQVAEALEMAAMKGARITAELRNLAMDATLSIVRDEPLTQEQARVLEGIVLGNGLRPAFDVEDDSFDPLPSAWDDVNGARNALVPLIQAVGRLEVVGHPRASYVGTAFVCGDNLLLTNRHVAEEFMASGVNQFQLRFKPGMLGAVDLKEEVSSTVAKVLELTGEAAFSTEWDVAVIRVKSLPADIHPAPMEAEQPATLQGRTVAVFGYPAFDESEDLVEQIKIFKGVFNKKRLQPGKLLGLRQVMSYGKPVSAMAHDCSTLGGNSGSAVVDIGTCRIAGVHFGGDSVANYCVPTWALKQIPSFAPFLNSMNFG